MDCQCGNKGKYKCPKCFEKYCSSECCNSHKALCKIVKEVNEPAPVVRHPPRNFLMEEEDETVLTDEELGKMSNF